MRKSPQRRTPLVVEDIEGFAKKFPASHHLLVTTPNHIYEWSLKGCTQVFRSRNGGIITAKKIQDGSDRLAICDSQVVVLHEPKNGMEKSYRLKGAEGRVRLLQYVEESETLHFTTSLQDSVQTYSLQHAKVLDSGHVHPSPISCFAFSRSKGFTVSASARPPTICLQNQTSSARPIFISPKSSSAPVICSSFHPRKAGLFLLAFADQILTIYDYNRIARQARRVNGLGKASGGDQIGEIGHIQLQLAPGTGQRNGSRINGDTTIDIKNQKLVAAEFLPGDRLQVATVSSDGQCSIVDFDNEHQARTIQSWNVHACATSLAILEDTEGREDFDSCYIAIGQRDGKVSVFNATGKLLAHQIVGTRDKVSGVDWIKSVHESTLLKAQVSAAREQQPSKKSSGRSNKGEARQENVSTGTSRVTKTVVAPPRTKSLKAETTEPAQEVFNQRGSDTADLKEQLAERDRPTSKVIDWQDVIEPYSTNYMDFFSPVKTLPSRRINQKSATLPRSKVKTSGSLHVKELANGVVGEIGTTISAPQLWEDKSALVQKGARPPAIPTRPAPKKRRRVSMPKVESTAKRRRSGDAGLATTSSSHQNDTVNKIQDRQAKDDVWLPGADQKVNQLARSTRASRFNVSKSISDSKRGSQKSVSFDEPDVKDYQDTCGKTSAFGRIDIHVDSDHDGEQMATPLRKSSIKSRKPTPRTRRFSADHSNALSPSKSANYQSQMESPSKHEPENCACQSPSYLHDEVAKLRTSMRKEMSAFQFDLKKQFLAQKMVFEDVLAKERTERRLLKREVEILKREMAEKEKGAGGLLVGL